jgi:mono/diheme cytochrome c family protein
MMRATPIFWAVALWFVLIFAGCGGSADTASSNPLAFPGQGLGKSDVFGRQLAGVAAPYEADLSLLAQTERIISEMGYRRQVAWDIVARVLDPVPLLGLAEAAEENEELQLPDGEVPQVARWQTWYGIDDFKRMFRHLYEGLTPEERALRQSFTQDALDEAFTWNATALERSERWPLDRFLKYVSELGVCDPGLTDEECANSLQSKFSGSSAGNARISYSPATMRHLLQNYGAILDCVAGLETLSFNEEPAQASNFSFCFEQEFPTDAVLIKAQWIRSDFGRTMPAYDTDVEGLKRVVGEGSVADWADGDRQVDPTPEEIVTIQLKSTDTYRLAAMHIMTKELRHWTWITLWWSDRPDVDFGADRPEKIRSLDPVWSNYKMAVTVDYVEFDTNTAAWFPEQPSLAAALEVTQDELSWSSNPYVEHGRGNARTNCIGCHQHGGSLVGYDVDGDQQLDPFDLDAVIESESLFPKNGRTQMRDIFPADYLWSTNRVDNLSQVIQSEVAFFDFLDKDTPEIRSLNVLALEADAGEGAKTFAENCTTCHGSDGTGSATAPSLYDRVPGFTDAKLVQRLILGKSPMPAWAYFSDQKLADLRSYLRMTFDP